MAWTSPRTWVAGEKPTAATMNTHIRDNLNAIGAAWTAYTPVWTATTTNPAIGNGTLTGGYMSAGKLVNFWAQIAMGSTTTYGTGQWELDLPVSESNHRWMFQGCARSSVTYSLIGERSATNKLTLRVDPTTAGTNLRAVTSLIPITWASTDVLFISGTYEAS